MRSSSVQVVATIVTAICISSISTASAHFSPTHYRRSTKLPVRDISTIMSGLGPANNEGEAHGEIVAPNGSTFTSVDVGTTGESIAAYWTANPNNDNATQAFIMIHGKLRNGDTYWTTMNDALETAVDDDYPGVDSDAIVVAPQFFSTILNSGQYSSDELAWGDVNAWQAGDIATHPNNTVLTSFDALDALVDNFSNSTKYPAMKNVTVVGHGGGGQLISRYAMVAKDAPANLHVRYIHGDPSSCAYFTTDRPTAMSSGYDLPSPSSCDYFNTWRYGFDNFTGTAQGLKSPQQYFQQYITRDVISIVGYQDVETNGDTYCMANMQGGSKRRDRNLSWWQYVNTLARTNEDLTGFPATFSNLPDWSNISGNAIEMQLIVVEDADHNATLVFGSDEGRAALFSSAQMPTGWRPQGWAPAPPLSPHNSTTGSMSNNATTDNTKSDNASSASPSTAAASGALPFINPPYLLLVAASTLLPLHLLL
ncbi:hypothetical protein CBS101457_001204 [Exobasidium rhododendri]|nr:hypothetical protein CBS101457_001204 [Exobasidium rhododendri]